MIPSNTVPLSQSKDITAISDSENFFLQISQLGLLDSLKFSSTQRQKPDFGEVEIEVIATGLNFKEVLLALGLIPAPSQSQIKFGLECAGKIVAVGEGVEGFEIGDEVIAFGASCFSKFMTISAQSITLKPTHLSLEEAATIPVAFMTAYYALITLGRLSKGDRILIHSATGGVGLAAVQIAQWVGAEIFATAGNLEKQEFLRSLGIEHVMNSRSLAFAEEVMQRSDRRGVDVVLNSLGGEAISKNLAILAPYGRFLELGRRDILNNSQLNLLPFEKNLSFFAINIEPERSQFRKIWHELVRHFQAGNFRPLPHHIFPINSVARAFEYMSEAKHIGKVIVSFQGKEEQRKSIITTKNNRENLSQVGLLPTEGADIFSRILGSTLPQVFVSTRNLLLENKLENTDIAVDSERLDSSKQTYPRPDLSSPYVAFRNEIEQKIINVWQEYLGIEPIGIHDDFFELGGHSLLATRLVSKLSSVFGVELLLSQLFESPTVASLAVAIGTEATQEAKQPDVANSLPAIALAPEQRYQPFPLTDVQQAYWIGRSSDFELGNVSTHFYGEFDCINLDIDRYNRAWQQLISRHEMLRAIVRPDGQQQILEQVPPFQIQVQDLRGKSQKEVELEIEKVRDCLSHQVIPSDRFPLFEICASLLDSGRVRIHISFDALIADLRSIEIILQELYEIYQNPHVSLKSSELSFRDYVLALENLQISENYQRALDYWLHRLPQLPPAPELPLVKNLAAIGRSRFHRRIHKLDAEIWGRLKHRVSQSNLTPSGLLIAAFAEVLTVWSRRSQFTLNLTLFNRLPLHPEVDEIVGDFTSLTLLAVDNSQAESFEIRAQRLQKQLWEDLDRSYVSGVRVLREWSKIQGGGGILMPVVFTSNLVQQGAASQPSAISKFGELVYSVSQTPQVILDHQVYEDGGALILNWDSVDEVFPEGLLDDMLAAYCDLLRQLATTETAWQATKRQVHVSTQQSSNFTDAPIPEGLLHAKFFQQVQQQPDRVAVVASNRTLTYRELFCCVNRIGHRLRNLGATPNQLVAVVMEKGWEQVVAVLGILTAGAAYLPIDPDLPQERIAYLLENSAAYIVLSQSWLVEKLELPAGIETICLDTTELEQESDEPLEAVQQPTDLAYVIYTSGSTGLPKGVAIDHRGALNTIVDINQRFQIGAEDRVLAVSALSFDLSVYDIFGTLAAGGAIAIPDAIAAKDPAHWAELIVRDRVTVWNSVPALMQLFVDHVVAQPVQLETLRLVLLSGDWLPLTLPPRIKDLMPTVEIISLGGATEASIWSILYPVADIDPAWKSIPYGRPMQNQRFYVLNEMLEPCPVWVSGQLYIGGIGLAQGYWRDEEKTAASFITHPETGDRLYRTGDLGRYLPDGNIEFLGREDFQLKVRGYRIEAGEIEAALMQHSQVRAAVVTAMRERGNEQLVAYIVSESSEPAKQIDFLVDRQAENLILDPVDRLEFRLKQPGLRQIEQERKCIQLPFFNLDENRLQKYVKRQSYRQFNSAPIPLKQVVEILNCLSPVKFDGSPLPKYRYASAGHLYPVQTYLYVKPGRVEGIEAGTYYYHPVERQLILLSSNSQVESRLYSEYNQPIFDSSAFSLFLVGQLDSITPLYGELAKEFCLLEAGYMSQLLMTEAPEHKIGLCPIGDRLDSATIQNLFELGSSHVLLHSFLGGQVEHTQTIQWLQPEVKEDVQDINEQLRRFLKQKLPEYTIPTVYVNLDALPLTSNGKVNRQALPAPITPKLEKTYVAPQTPQEKMLAQIWREVLSLEQIGINDNFFELGGNSLQATQILTQVRKQLPMLEISLRQLLTAATIVELARVIEDKLIEKIAELTEEEAEDLLQLINNGLLA